MSKSLREEQPAWHKQAAWKQQSQQHCLEEQQLLQNLSVGLARTGGIL